MCSSGHWMLRASGGTCCRRGSEGGMRGDGVGGGSAGGVGDARAEADGARAEADGAQAEDDGAAEPKAEGDGARAEAMSQVGRRFFPTYPRWRALTSVVRAGSLSLVTQFARRSRVSTRHARVATKWRVVAVTMDAVRSMHVTKGRTSASKIVLRIRGRQNPQTRSPQTRTMGRGGTRVFAGDGGYGGRGVDRRRQRIPGREAI